MHEHKEGALQAIHVWADRYLYVQVLPDAPVCKLVSLNLLQLEKPTFHIAPYLPSVKASHAPLLFIWHVRDLLQESMQHTF